eukprot:m.260347 g.260347  ORF g.260347 m.260347 type:complete len:274 (+) comp54600_c0_seq5:162-983(+)
MVSLLLDFTTICNRHLLFRLAVVAAQALDGSDDIHAVNDVAEDHMLAIEPVCLCSAEEELGPVGIGTRVGHREDTCTGVLQREVLVLECAPVDRLAACAVVSGEVAALAHETRDHPVEAAAPEPKPALVCAQLSEVLGGAWHNVVAQLEATVPRRESNVNGPAIQKGGEKRNEDRITSLDLNKLQTQENQKQQRRRKETKREEEDTEMETCMTMRPAFSLPMLMSKNTSEFCALPFFADGSASVSSGPRFVPAVGASFSSSTSSRFSSSCFCR